MLHGSCLCLSRLRVAWLQESEPGVMTLSAGAQQMLDPGGLIGGGLWICKPTSGDEGIVEIIQCTDERAICRRHVNTDPGVALGFSAKGSKFTRR